MKSFYSEGNEKSSGALKKGNIGKAMLLKDHPAGQKEGCSKVRGRNGETTIDQVREEKSCPKF